MEETPPNPMPRLYERLSDAGFPGSFIRGTVLPSWWDDEAAHSDAGYAQALLIVSRRLGLDYASLRDDAAPIAPAPGLAFKLKTSTQNTDPKAAASSARVATQVGRLVALGAPQQKMPLGKSAIDIRRQIRAERPCVDLQGLLDYCWAVGIVVVHLDFPKAKRLHGLAVKVGGRPVVIVCDGRKPSAWSLFVVAHELGHFVLGHLGEDGVMVDETIDTGSVDVEEAAANAFAIELLTGRPNWHAYAPGRWPSSETLAREAIRMGAEGGIDPGHIVLNYAQHMSAPGKNFWPVAAGALKRIEPDAGGPALIRRLLAERLVWDELPEDVSEFVARLAKIGSDSVTL